MDMASFEDLRKRLVQPKASEDYCFSIIAQLLKRHPRASNKMGTMTIATMVPVETLLPPVRTKITNDRCG